ncbi:MAG TPA: PAS domain S-box protein, partial [Roseiflexaceae bacterium]|nr:PAS domain S-box protein [Roseiflexaceae bacterium]
MRLSISSFPRKIILQYIVFAGAWIAFSDRLLVALISDPHSEGWLQTAKGWMFVAVSAFLLNALLRRELRIRQQAEAALRQSEQRYRRIVETIEEGIWIVDADNRTSFVNPKMAAMLGYSPEEMSGTSLFDYMDAEGQAIARANLERRRQGISEQIEAKLRHKDGSEIWALVASSPVEDEQGRYAGVLAAITDITERKLAERAVRESEERFRRLSEATFEGVGICAHDVIIDANVRLAEMLGYTRAELVGMPTDRLIALESRELVRQQVQTDYQGSYEHLALRKDGSMFPVEVRSRPLPEQGPAMRVTIVQDISERWAAQQALTQSEQRFRAIFEQTTIGIALVNIAGHPIVSNPALQTFLGYSANELRDMTFAMFTHPEDVGSDVALFTELVNGIRESYQLEKRYIRKDGQIVWGRMTASLITHDGDESILGIGMIEDITERKRIEQQYLESQKMEALGRLAGGVAHDFNNLLTVILGSSELLLNELGHNHPLSRDIVPIQNAGMHAAALTRQLLTFSRHQVRQLDIVNLNMVVLRMETLLRRSLGEDVLLVTELAPDLAEVQIDVSQLEQVLLNLAVNARDAMPSGGQLTIETANAVLDGSMSGVPH